MHHNLTVAYCPSKRRRISGKCNNISSEHNGLNIQLSNNIIDCENTCITPPMHDNKHYVHIVA